MDIFRPVYGWLCVTLLAGCTLMHSSKAYCDLIVEIDDISFVPGQVGVVSVWVSSTDSNSVYIFNYEFLIVGAPGNSSTLRFLESQSNTELADNNYIFSPAAGGSGGFTSMADNGPAFDSIQGGDYRAAGGDVTVDGGQKLLVQLDVEHVLPEGASLEDAVGDSFTIMLVESDNTFFTDSNFADQSISPISYTNHGTLSITATPEPSVTLLAIIACGAGLAFRKNRGSTHHVEDCPTDAPRRLTTTSSNISS